ncbi:DsbA family protein [Leuconostoc gelidum subsp. aenigmaticum]|uniref:DsbA family protein n=1 Tax=Leuconostoc gelidum TaxID=1244 RepID=UPI001C7D3590|nr:DsbA family protein [Leuconostoc gelidum]MBZ6003038.1 DsbA family protein [Leuconostoc gelidum subsp. aenigmaticum]MBZ6010623.1 DsbA family protein [Leuconostoc gelidum subsp. aenigmaticum]
MIDIYHFSNPLSTHCLTTEQCLTNITSDIAQHTHLHFVPLISTNFIANLENRALNFSNNHRISDTSEILFNVILDFKAAQLEGNKKARNFLVQLQHELLINQKTYTAVLVAQILDKIGINRTDFLINRANKEAISAIIKDQKFAEKIMQKKCATIALTFSKENETQVLTDFSVNDLVLAFAPHLTPTVDTDRLLQNLKAYAY